MFDWLTSEVSGSPVTYLVAAGAAAADVLFPLIPAETVVIAAAIVAAHGGLAIELLVAAVAAGAVVGDNIAFLLGDRAGDPVSARLFRGDRARARLHWAQRAVRRRGSVLILAGRFLPGGRTASTFAAGTLGMPWRRMIVADVAAAVLWALYASMLGYLGGETFGDSLWKPLLVASAIALAVGAATEGWRRIQRRRGRDVLGDPSGPPRSSADAAHASGP